MMPRQRSGSRTMVLRLIRAGRSRVAEIQEELKMDKDSVLYQLRTLRRGGFVAYDGRKHRYAPGPVTPITTGASNVR